MKHRNKIIMGSAISIAAILVTIDHTKHSLPEPEVNEAIIIQDISGEAPCSLINPCALGGSGVEEFIIQDDSATSPCSLGNSTSPCSL